MTLVEGWTAVPTWIIRESDLTGNELAVLLVLLSRANATGVCWPSLSSIAKDSRCHRATVIRALDSLRAKGFVTWTQRRDDRGDMTSNVYRTHVENHTDGWSHDATTLVASCDGGGRTERQRTRPSELDPPQGGGLRPVHDHEPNARRALAALNLAADVDELLAIAYTAGKGDPWAGYLALKSNLDDLPAGVRDLPALLRHRLGLAKAATR